MSRMFNLDAKEATVNNVLKSYGGHLSTDPADGGYSSQDYSDDEEEGEESYRAGGYHPISIGDKFNNGRYIVIEKLGWGHFSTVWMCYDKKKSQEDCPHLVAMKVQKSAPNYREAALDEIELLKCVTNAVTAVINRGEYPVGFDPHVVRLCDSFDHMGPNGKHLCMVFEMLGENLLKVIKRYNYRGIPLSIVKSFTKQICFGLDFLHRHCQIIHTDLKPENILISAPLRSIDPDRVASLVTDKVSSNGVGKKKKSGIASSNHNSSDLHEHMAKMSLDEDAKGGDLTADQRKKLKKKLKKKRQQRKKKDEAKKQQGGRSSRKNRREAGKRLESSLEKDQAKQEMMLMERHSVPLVEPSEPKSRSAGGHGGALDVQDAKAMSKDVLGDGDEEKGEHTSSSYASLLRPSVFGFINLDYHTDRKTQLPATHTPKVLKYNSIAPISKELYVSPSALFSASLPMVLPVDRLVSVLGLPQKQDVHVEGEEAEDEWYYRLQLSPVVAEVFGGDSDIEDISDTFFAVRSLGQHLDYLPGLVSSCLIHPSYFGSSEWGILGDEKMVVFELLHHAAMTEHIIAFFEKAIPGF
eukprot:scaffold620_cov177-Ochromonas_danica.AAC.24